MDTKAFREGFRDGIPIGLGYLAVSFSLGISAKQAGLTPLQGFVTSFLENASAGEYIAFTLIGAGATYIELCLMTIIANARYLLMSCAMSQRFSPDTPMIHRFFVAFDSIFSIKCANFIPLCKLDETQFAISICANLSPNSQSPPLNF